MMQSEDDDPIYMDFKDHNKYIAGLKFSLDGKYLASTSHDRSIQIYKLKYKYIFLLIVHILFI